MVRENDSTVVGRCNSNSCHNNDIKTFVVVMAVVIIRMYSIYNIFVLLFKRFQSFFFLVVWSSEGEICSETRKKKATDDFLYGRRKEIVS